ncbi:MAG: hypothetical protein ACOYMA_08685 [Bacteroidia bacterium]
MKKIRTVISVIILTCLSVIGYAQKKRNVGLSAGIQSNQYGISMPVWVSDKVVLEPYIGLKYINKVGSELSLGFTPKYYFKNEKIAPYIGLGLGLVSYKPADENVINKIATTSFVSGFLFGIDYFLDPKFSIGVQAQGNFLFPNGSSYQMGIENNVIFNTASAVVVSIYF